MKQAKQEEKNSVFIDAHTHIDEYSNEDLKKAIKEINENKILSIANSMSIESYIKSKKISEMSSYVVPTFGIHPWKAKGCEEDLYKLIPYIEETPIIGEIGLDFFWVEDKTSFESQIKVFEFFLREAKRLDKVINVHTKGAEEEVLSLLDKYSMNRVIVHWYSGSKDVLYKMIDRGYYFTISTELFYSETIREIASIIPINKMFVETDGPGAEEWLSGNIGMPKLILKTMETLSKMKKLIFEEVEQQMEHNFSTLVGKDIYMTNRQET